MKVKFLQKIWMLFFALTISFASNAQITLTPSDTIVCPGDEYRITGSFASQFDDISTDDIFGGEIEIGFPFEFYGETFSQCVISANNFLTFDMNRANLGSSWVYGSAKDGGQLDRVIMFPFQDINMGLADPGKINYQTFGVAPNRFFVVEFCDTKLFSCNTPVINQVVLFETSNIIEMHIRTNNSCPSWNQGTAIQGLRFDGAEDLVPGRNLVNTPWSATEDGRRFTYNGAGGYTIDTIPFDPKIIIPDVSEEDIVWYEAGNSTAIGIGEFIDIAVEENVPYYLATISGFAGCGSSEEYTFVDTAFVTMGIIRDTLAVDICQGDSFLFNDIYYDQTGFYTYHYSNPTGCDSFSVLNLSINPNPVALLLDSTDRIFCENTSAQLQVLMPNPNHFYQWYNDNGEISGAEGVSYSVTETGNYHVVVETNKGCTDTSSIVNVTENIVDIDFNIIVKPGCTEDTVQMENLSEDGLYFWSFGEGNIPYDTNKNAQYIYQNQDEYTIRLIVENVFGCRDTLSKSVDVKHPLSAQFSQSADSLCQNTEIIVAFSDQSIGSIVSWDWDFGDSHTSTDKNPNHAYTLSGNHNVSLIVTDTLGCKDTMVRHIYIDSLPDLKLLLDKNALCRGNDVIFQLEGHTPTTILNWDFGDGNAWADRGDGSGMASHSYETSGEYYVSLLANSLVCQDVVVLDTVLVNDFPIVDLGPDSTMCLDGNTIVLTNLHSSPPNATYSWNTGDTSSSLNVTNPGNYSLTVSVNGCSSTESMVVNKDCYTNLPNAFTPNGDGENDYFYPRQLLTEGVVSFTMSIYNRWGQKVFETSNLNGRGWDGKFNDIEQQMGVYIYQIDVRYKNGRTENYSGNVTLVR